MPQGKPEGYVTTRRVMGPDEPKMSKVVYPTMKGKGFEYLGRAMKVKSNAHKRRGNR